MNWQRLSGLLTALLALWIGIQSVIWTGCQSGGGGGTGPDTSDTTGNGENGDSLLDRIVIPEGEFIQGYNAGELYPDAFPAAEIKLDSFYISKTEVTNQQYAEFLNDQDNEIYYYGEMYIHNVDDTFIPNNGYENHPVVFVDYVSATKYAQWVGGRLPTEAEWEKAARGTEGQEYPWGNEYQDQMADIGRGLYATTMPVGRFPEGASPYGVLDMSGSVWEWCYDLYDENYYSWIIRPYENPTGPDSTQTTNLVRVIRGGSFMSPTTSAAITTFFRYWKLPEYRLSDLGFRVAWDD